LCDADFTTVVERQAERRSRGLLPRQTGAAAIIDMLEQGKIVGLFAGAAEFGRRALGIPRCSGGSTRKSSIGNGFGRGPHGTARVQTVHPELSPAVSGLLSEWHRRTDVPVLVNTSFNDREPIVETPEHALDTFQRVPIDCLCFLDHGIVVAKESAGLRTGLPQTR
jgi:predicted NodU family carbamoyl transferase